MNKKDTNRMTTILDAHIKACVSFLERDDTGKDCVRREIRARQSSVACISSMLLDIGVISYDRWIEIGHTIQLCGDDACDSETCAAFVDGKCKYNKEATQ